MSEQHRGKIIMFDGPDGVGKTTQIEKLASYLSAEGFDVHSTRAHGGTAIGEALREVSLDATLPRNALTDCYVSLAIHSSLADDISTRRAEGQIVLVDRSPLSIWAYQVYGSGLNPEFVDKDIDQDMELLNPDLVICYKASLAVLRNHMANRGSKTDYFESKPDSYFDRVIEGYNFSAQRYRAVVIDAEQSVEAVHDETLHAIRQHTGLNQQ